MAKRIINDHEDVTVKKSRGTIDAVIKEAFGEDCISWSPVGEQRSMGLSGSLIQEVRCTYNQPARASPLLLFKCTRKRAPMLAPEATEADRMKAERNDFSYQSECLFLKAHAQTLLSHGCAVPRPWHISTQGEFTILMESLSASLGWQQYAVIPAGASTRAVLRWLAKFHALYLPVDIGGGGCPLQTEGAWDSGLQNMALERRPAGEVDKLSQTLESFAEAFASAEPYFATEGARRLGSRLQAVARDVNWQLRPATHSAGGGAKLITMTHGDFMHSNIFLRETPHGEAAEAAVIDWQWGGPGVAAVDLFFLCAQSLADETVADYQVNVLRSYHEELVTALGGKRDAYSYEQLYREFKLAGLNFLRWLTGARLEGFTPAKMQAAAATADMNRGMVRKSMPRMVWLWQLTEQFVNDAEEHRLYPPRS